MANKYSLLLPYENRIDQLRETLLSILAQTKKQDRARLEIIVIVDRKSTHQLPEVRAMVDGTGICSIVQLAGLSSYNPAPHYNQAARLAWGNILLLSSPEVCWGSNIIEQLDREMKDGEEDAQYVIGSCRSLDPTGNLSKWYQHSVHRPANYHFFTAISKQAWEIVGGFDEDYRDGIGYDDDDFLMRIKIKGYIIPDPVDSILTYHQYHPPAIVRGRRALLAKNRALFESRWEGGGKQNDL